jgi:hypothetical protein
MMGRIGFSKARKPSTLFLPLYDNALWKRASETKCDEQSCARRLNVAGFGGKIAGNRGDSLLPDLTKRNAEGKLSA